MDPTATLNLIYDAMDLGDMDAAEDAAKDLLDWLNKGGFPPTGLTAKQARHLCLVVRDAAETHTTLEI